MTPKISRSALPFLMCLILLSCVTAFGQGQLGDGGNNNENVSGSGPVTGSTAVKLKGILFGHVTNVGGNMTIRRPNEVWFTGKSKVSISNLGDSAVIIRRVTLYRTYRGAKHVYYSTLSAKNQNYLNESRFESTQADNTTLTYTDPFTLRFASYLPYGSYTASVVLEYKRARSSVAIKFAETDLDFKIRK